MVHEFMGHMQPSLWQAPVCFLLAAGSLAEFLEIVTSCIMEAFKKVMKGAREEHDVKAPTNFSLALRDKFFQ